MFHVVFSLASRFLYLRNILQGFARGILALRSLDTISSYLTPALSPPPHVPLLDSPVPFAERPEQIIFPYPSRDVIAIERQFPVFASPFPIYQSSLIAVTPSQFPKFLPLLVILAVISGFVVILPEIAYFFMNIAKMPSAFTHGSSYIANSFKSFYCLPTSLPYQFASSKLPISLISLLLLWTGPPAIATFFTFVWFMSILFSYEQVSNVIVAILQWCGLLIVQDTQTPPLLDAMYEQITRGAAGYSDLVRCSDLPDEHNKYQVITDYSLGYSHLAAQLSAHEAELQNAPMPRENEKLDVSMQRIHIESVNSQNLHRQLELSRVREQKLDVDLLASEQERERLIELVSTTRRNQQGWKDIAAVAKELYLEGEVIASNLRADLAAATDRVRDVQEQLEHQIELTSGKESIIQSITKESRLAHTRLRLERDRRLRETKEFLHEKVMIRNRYESEMRHLIQEAQNAQEQLDALRDEVRQSPSVRDYLPGYQPPTTWPYDTGQAPLPPEWNLNSGTPPVGSAIDSDSSRRFTKWSPHSHVQDSMDSSTRLAARLLEIPGVCDQESEVTKEQRAALAELIERMRQVEPESTGDVKPNDRDKKRLQEELIATKEQLRLTEEDVRELRRELGQSKESLREMESHVRAVEHELDICRATVREAQDAQYASEAKFTEATELLRVHQTESESSMAKAEESEFKCSQVTFLCTALRERVTELEAKVEKLKSARKYRTHSNSRLRRPTGEVAHDPGIRESDSIYMTIPPSMPRLLDLPLPPSSLPSNDSSLYLSNQECPTMPLAPADSGSCCLANTDPEHEVNTHDIDGQTFDSIFLTTPPSLPCLLDLPLPASSSQSSTSSPYFSRQAHPATSPTRTDSHSSSPDRIDLDVTTPDANSQILDSSLSPQESTNLCHLLPLPQSELEDFSLPPFLLPRTFLSERNSLGSVDWPPIGSLLPPEHGNARQDDNISLRSPTEGDGDDSILLCQKALSPIKELDEVEVPERHTSVDRDRPVVSDDDRKSWGLSQRSQTLGAPPIWTPSSPQLPTLPTSERSERRVDIPVKLEREEVTYPSLASRDHGSEPLLHSASSSRIILDLPLPVFPRMTLPRFFLSPSGIDKMLDRRLGSSEPGNDRNNTKVGSAAPHLDSFLSSAQNGEFHSTEASSFPHGGTLSMSPTASQESQDVCRAVPTHIEHLNPFSAAGPASAGVMTSWTSPNTISPPVHPPSISSALRSQDVQRSSSSRLRGSTKGETLVRVRLDEVLASESMPLCSSRTTQPGSLPSRLRTSSDQGSSVRARRRRDLVSRSSNVSSAQSDKAPEAFLPPSSDFPITTFRSSGILPLSQTSNLSLARRDVKTQAVKRITKSMPQPSPSRLVPKLLDQAFIQSDGASLDEDDPPCASGKAPKGRNIPSRLRDTSSPDCFPSGDSVPSFGRASLERQDHEFEDFVFFIPPDCPTSTPVASRKRACRKGSVGSGAAASAGVSPLATSRLIEAIRY